MRARLEIRSSKLDNTQRSALMSALKVNDTIGVARTLAIIRSGNENGSLAGRKLKE